jgi:hypothetical protein
LILGPTAEVPSRWTFAVKWVEDAQAAMQLVIARMFNDFEATKHLILHGLCEQIR